MYAAPQYIEYLGSSDMEIHVLLCVIFSKRKSYLVPNEK